MCAPILDRAAIQQILPHRDPMLLVDSVWLLEEGQCIETSFFVDDARDIFRGHFPGEPVLPGVYTVESMAQTADILLLRMPGYAGKIPLFLGIDGVKFLRKILPGETLHIRAELSAHRPEKGIATCSCRVFVAGTLAATGDVTLAMR